MRKFQQRDDIMIYLAKAAGFLLETRRNWISTSTQILGWGWKWDWEQEYSSEKAMR